MNSELASFPAPYNTRRSGCGKAQDLSAALIIFLIIKKMAACL